METIFLAVDIEDGQIQAVRRFDLQVQNIEEESGGVDMGRTHHRAWQVSPEILVVEDKE